MYSASNYPDSTIDTFELLGSKIVSVFWNHIYDKAKELQAGGHAPSTTEAYRTVSQTYLLHFKEEKLFKQSLANMYEHFNHYSPVPTASYATFVDTVVREFVHTDFWPGMQGRQKDRILGTVLENVHKKVAAFMISPDGLRRVIDDHKNRENIVHIQNLAVQYFIEEREQFHQKFAKPLVGGGTNAVTERLRSDLAKTLGEKKKLMEALQKASLEIKELHTAAQKQVEAVTILTRQKEWLVERARTSEEGRLALAAELLTLKRGGAAPAPVAAVAAAAAYAPYPADAPAEPAHMPAELLGQEFDPYEEIEDPDDAAAVPEPADDAKEALKERMRQKAKERKARRGSNVEDADDLGF